jgi:hypothetical protein
MEKSAPSDCQKYSNGLLIRLYAIIEFLTVY